jgi:hypothetical protein
MDDLLLIDGLMKIALLIGIMVLVATAPSRAAAAAGHGLPGALFTGLFGSSAAVHRNGGSMTTTSFDAAADDDLVNWSALEPPVFIDTESVDHEPDHWRYDNNHVPMMEFDLFEPSTNIDGTPMAGCCDINGNAYGVTENHFEDSWGGGMPSMFD